MQRNRPVLVALAAVFTELVVIAGAANQATTKTITNHLARSHPSLANHMLASLVQFTWRLTPQKGTPAQHLWGAQFAGIGAFLLLTYLLVVLAARGQAGLGQVFMATWSAVVAAAVVGTVVRGIVFPYTLGGSRVDVGVFAFPNGETTFFGFACGLLVALFAVLVGKAARRTIEPDEPVDGAYAGDGYDYAPPQNYPQPPPFVPPISYPSSPPAGPPEPTERITSVPSYDAPSYSGPGYAPDASPTAASAPASAPASASAPPSAPAPASGPAASSAPPEPSREAAPDVPSEPSAPDVSSEGPSATDGAADPPPAEPAPEPHPTETITPYSGGEQHTAELPQVPPADGSRTD